MKKETSEAKSRTSGGSAIHTQTDPTSSSAPSHLHRSKSCSWRTPGHTRGAYTTRNSRDAQTASCSDMSACLLLNQPHENQPSTAKLHCFHSRCQNVTVQQEFLILMSLFRLHKHTFLFTEATLGLQTLCKRM